MPADPELRTIGQAVRRRRLELGMSQEELADAAGLHRNYVGGIERGERNVGVKAILVLARALATRPGTLFDAY
ncbi:helix-turn-helix domain-containing protein [Caulobacter segnis]|uniref:XRE family transcriptional regulator n=1 Tax=Caulobacter segnis TaxID=88688 RepID=A0A2W5V4F9_9CAUL|nr:helix-turn-helix transcriptional regulator [Caulobacter segnis]PZR34879.1 MAG: XRE family transcriptional regulator [Caulobacter segnis]